jgi:hypothetical protein
MSLPQGVRRSQRRAHGTEFTNRAYGTVYGLVEGKKYPVVDTACYAPFGFGYRRCAGELITVELIKEFLRTVWKAGLTFLKLGLANPEKLPVGPGTVIHNSGFKRADSHGNRSVEDLGKDENGRRCASLLALHGQSN